MILPEAAEADVNCTVLDGIECFDAAAEACIDGDGVMRNFSRAIPCVR